jgi:hypothetical protein
VAIFKMTIVMVCRHKIKNFKGFKGTFDLQILPTHKRSYTGNYCFALLKKIKKGAQMNSPDVL